MSCAATPLAAERVMSLEQQELMVEIASLVALDQAKTRLCTPPLGTGVAVAIFDPLNGAGGVLHALLPDSTLDEARALDQPALFVDTGLQALFHEFGRHGGDLARARVCAAGGMEVMGGEKVYDLGRRNRLMLINMLPVLGVALHSSELGGYKSASLTLNLATGEVTVRRAGQPEGQESCKR